MSQTHNADAMAGRALAPHTLLAHNFAAASANKIHDDEVAARRARALRDGALLQELTLQE